MSALSHPLSRKYFGRWTLLALAVRIPATVLLHSVSTRNGYDGYYPFGAAGDDRLYFSTASSIARGGSADNLINAYPRFLGFLFKITGPNLLVGQLTNAVIGSATVGLAMMLVQAILLRTERTLAFTDARIYRACGIALLFYPSFVFSSTQLLKDPLVHFFGVLTVLSVVRLLDSTSIRTMSLLAIGATGLLAVRPYALAAIGIGTAFAVALRRPFSRRSAGLLFTGFVALALGPKMIGYGFFGVDKVNFIFASDGLTAVRKSVYSVGESSLGIRISGGGIIKNTANYFYVFFSVAFGPFPWQINSPATVLGLVESIPFVVLFPTFLAGVRDLVRRRGSASAFLVGCHIGLVGLISFFGDNVGANIRLRVLPTILLLCAHGIRRPVWNLGRKELQAMSTRPPISEGAAS